MLFKQYIALLTGAMVICGCIQAQDVKNNVVTTAVPFLRISPDAAASAMGSTALATTPDVSAVYYNMAKLPFVEQQGALSANYSPWLKQWSNDMYFAALAGYYKLNDNEAVHGALRYFNLGNIQFTDNSGNDLQSYKPNEFSADIGYSRKLSQKIGIGLGVKYIRSSLVNGSFNGQDYEAGNAIAADLGLYYKSNNWSFGTQLSNFGSKISYDKQGNNKSSLPTSIGLGAAYIKRINDQSKVTFAADVNSLIKAIENLQLSAGAEYWYNDLLALRLGYFYENENSGNRKYFSTGIGLRHSVITFNFAYLAPSSSTSNKPLSNTLLFGINISL